LLVLRAKLQKKNQLSIVNYQLFSIFAASTLLNDNETATYTLGDSSPHDGLSATNW
jgi:hypothetical protein